MSWSQFEKEVVEKLETQGFKDPDAFAKFFTNKYDECIRRGKDNTTFNAVLKGNKEFMYSMMQITNFTSIAATTPALYDLYFNMLGDAVVGYWSGAKLTTFFKPIIPAPGTTMNVGVTDNSVVNPGIWVKSKVPPMKTVRVFVKTFISYAKMHLATIQGICTTISLYPPLQTPGPGIVQWQGYKVPDGIAIIGANISTMLFGGAKVVYDGNTLSHKGQKGWHSGNAADIFTKIGTPCYTPIGGIIEIAADYGPTVIVKDNKKLFGAGVVIRGTDGRKVYMTHLQNMPESIFRGAGKPILKGTFVGEVMDFPGGADHLHIGFIDGTSFKDYMTLDGKGTFL